MTFVITYICAISHLLHLLSNDVVYDIVKKSGSEHPRTSPI